MFFSSNWQQAIKLFPLHSFLTFTKRVTIKPGLALNHEVMTTVTFRSLLNPSPPTKNLISRVCMCDPEGSFGRNVEVSVESYSQ